MTSRLVALTGPAGCGKSTIARTLVTNHAFVRVRLAGPLKDMLRALGLTAEQTDGDAKETPCALLCGKTPRLAMQTLGTEWGRSMIGPDVWVNAAMRQVDMLLAAGRDVVIDDLRFDNEARALAGRRATIVQIHRSGAVPSLAHASEAGIAKTWLSFILDNNGSIYDTVESLLSKLP